MVIDGVYRTFRKIQAVIKKVIGGFDLLVKVFGHCVDVFDVLCKFRTDEIQRIIHFFPVLHLVDPALYRERDHDTKDDRDEADVEVDDDFLYAHRGRISFKVSNLFQICPSGRELTS